MSRVCSVCGKGKTFGGTVSHSHRVTNRAFEPNLQKVTVVDDKGTKTSEYICAKCIKTAKKKNK